jgi:beta-N-acetylglucosaminidase
MPQKTTMENYNSHTFDNQLEECKAILDRISRIYEKELDNADFYIDVWNNPDTIYRVRVSPENVTYVSDIGPAFKDLNELKAFLRGLEITGGDIEVKAKD